MLQAELRPHVAVAEALHGLAEGRGSDAHVDAGAQVLGEGRQRPAGEDVAEVPRVAGECPLQGRLAVRVEQPRTSRALADLEAPEPEPTVVVDPPADGRRIHSQEGRDLRDRPAVRGPQDRAALVAVLGLSRPCRSAFDAPTLAASQGRDEKRLQGRTPRRARRLFQHIGPTTRILQSIGETT